MFNPKRIETIRKNIQISTLLSDHEKSDWLNLLELMNDKQLGELEEILSADPNVQALAQQQNAPRPQAVRPQSLSNITSKPAAQQAPVESMVSLPPLSHIANMPTDVTMTHSVPANLTAEQKPSTPFSATSAPQVPTKPLPRITPSPNLSPLPPKPNYVKPGTESIARSPQNQPQAPAKIQPKTKEPLPAKTLPLGTYAITELGELQQLTLESIRTNTFQSIFDVIRQAIQTNGYFQVLQLIESSPLYESYIMAGKERLGAPAQQSTLTQEEFEFMTDLLRNIRFNP